MEKISSNIKASKTAKAGLQFPVSRFQRYLRKGNYAKHVGTAGSVYLAGVIEYLVAELLELSGDAAKDNKRARIIPRHLMLAIKNDVELNVFLSDAFFSDSGVMPNIHPHLLAKSTMKKAARSNDDEENDEENDEEDDEDEGDITDNGADAVKGSQNY